MEELIKVPKNRIAALIGKNGKTRGEIEKLTGTKITIDSKTGSVVVEGREKGLNFYNALNIIKAIARGFSPEKAFLLSSEDYYLDIIELDEIAKSKKQMEVKRGRVIGKKGKARESIERATDCFVSVYGKTIAIIGKADGIEMARKAIEMLLGGASHASVTGFLKRSEFQAKKFEL